MKIKDLLDVEELASRVEGLDTGTDKLNEKIKDNRNACLADIDPDVLGERIDLIIQQCFLQSFAVMKLMVATFTSEHEDEDIENLVITLIQFIQAHCEDFAEECQLQEISLALAEGQFDALLDELEEKKVEDDE